jgi:hypothetical protein
MMTTPHLGEAGVHPVVASAARELLNKSANERSGVLSTAMSFLGLYRDPVVAQVTQRCDWRIADLVDGAYANPKDVRLYLQDIDKAGVSTKSTSILTFEPDVGIMKTRTCAAFGETRGFNTNIVERRFDKDMRVLNSEPSLALCGVDNPHTRAILEDAGFSSVFEAGLGDGANDFRLIRTHSFPAARKANELWAEDGQVVILPDRLPPGYQDLVQTGALDQCGVTRLAEVAVGAPFVGAVAGALLISQTIRFVSDGRRPAVVNLDLRALQHRSILFHDASESVIFRTTSVGETD